jgi:hypothetical protein
MPSLSQGHLRIILFASLVFRNSLLGGLSNAYFKSLGLPTLIDEC